VAAVTGRLDTSDYLKGLGATTIVDRKELETPLKAPLGPERWSGAIDNVGGPSLGNLLPSLCYWGSCASVGNAAGIKFEATVIPFLLRGINLLGIDSATCPMDRRTQAWQRIARDLPMDELQTISRGAAGRRAGRGRADTQRPNTRPDRSRRTRIAAKY
jgi:acrylyl-CoA reductase (NADPH)